MKKILFLLVCIIATVSLVSCSGNMTEDSVKAELERLLPLSYEMNEIFWGKGLPVQDIDTKDRMVPVTADCGYASTEEILAKAAEVFSSDYLEEIKDAVFTDSDDITPRYADIGGVLKRDISFVAFNVTGDIVIDSAEILKQNKGMVIVSADYADGGTTEITLVLQDGKWYLNSPTY